MTNLERVAKMVRQTNLSMQEMADALRRRIAKVDDSLEKMRERASRKDFK